MNNLPEPLPTNPWIDLPENDPFVLGSDLDVIVSYNRLASSEVFVHLELLPEPFLGDPSAPVVLLALNPGFSPDDITHHRQPDFVNLSWQNLRHEKNQYPFYLLNPNLTTPGQSWWKRKLSHLISEKGMEVIAQRVFCIEYFPYHSRRYAHSKLVLSSQNYSFSLVRRAIERNAIIVILRGEKLWRNSVPELMKYRHLYQLRSARNVTITPNNCPSGYASILEAL